MIVIVAVTGLISGLCSAGLIALINTSLHQSGSFSSILVLAVVFIGVGKVAAGTLSQWLLAKFAQTTYLELTTELSRKALSAPFQRLEETGIHRILTAITGDVLVLVAAVQAIPSLAINAAVVLGCGSYLAWLYPLGFAVLCVAVFLGMALYKFLHSTAFDAIFRVREHRDLLMRAYRGLVDGMKELKMHRPRGDEFLSKQITATATELRRLELVATKRYVWLDIWSQSLFYLLIGGALFWFPRDGSASLEVLTGYIFAALYVMNPIWSIISTIPTFLNGQVSLGKLEDLGVLLTPEQEEDAIALAVLSNNPVLELQDLKFDYAKADGTDRYPFHLGPIDLTFKPGEIVFLVGGNGSGKSTLVKLLAGLYSPKGGSIKLGDQTITDANREWYRQHFSVVFSDFYLFDGLFGADGADVDSLSMQYLKQLELDHKVTVSDRMFSTTELSQGQRKRLALLTALIEDRPINVFDEWAADQDPHYKEIFYSVLLPRLKAKGKTVIVVTHDDRYFDKGDRVIKLQEGHFEQSAAISK